MVKERWREEEKTVVKRRCVNPFSIEMFVSPVEVVLGDLGFSLW